MGGDNGDTVGVKLNLGARRTELEGYVPVDISNGDRAYPLDRPDNSVAEIYASHILEHFSHKDVPQILAHWVSKLMPGGRMRLAVPDFEKCAKAYLQNEPVNVQGYIMGAHSDEHDHHGAIFDRASLSTLMVAAGLEQIHEWKPEIQDCSALPVSLNLAGFKPISEIKKCEATTAVLSAPRFGPMLHSRVAFDAFSRAGVPYVIAQGVYWHQVLCEALESLLVDKKHNPRYVMTTDYDTIFQCEDVLNLYRLMECFPAVDSICGMQTKRQDDKTILCNLRGPDDKPRTQVSATELLSQQLTPILTGHFGLTIFRAESLRNHERPWMVPRPNDENRWGKNHRDFDMDFWDRWVGAGKQAFMATRVALGHMEEVIAWPNKNMVPIYQHVRDFAQKGKPAEAWPACFNNDDQDSDSSDDGAAESPETP